MNRFLPLVRAHVARAARALALLTLAAFACACGETNATAPPSRDGPIEPAPIASTLPAPPAPTLTAALRAEDAGSPVRTPPDVALTPPAGLEPSTLGPAGKAFAVYLVGMHNRIHPLFADQFLSSLDALPPSHPLNDQRLRTSLEIALARDGTIDHVGITRSSGVTAFDIATLDSVMRAAPYGPPPAETLSADGKMYVGWTFTRDETLACSTQLAHPYLFGR